MGTRVSRPWRIEFNWTDTGIKGVDTTHDVMQAIRKRADMIELAEKRECGLTVVIRNRDTGDVIPMPAKCEQCHNRYCHPDPIEYDKRRMCRHCNDAIRTAEIEQREFVTDVVRLVNKAAQLGAAMAYTDSYSGSAGENGHTVTVQRSDAEFLAGPAYVLSALTAGRDPITVTGQPFPLPAAEAAAAWLHTLLRQSIEIPEGLTL